MRGEANFERALVLAHMRRVARLRDRADAVVPQYPRQRHLCRRGASVSRGDRLERRMAQQPALFDRRIGHDRHAALPGPRQQIVLDATAGEVVEHLIGRDRVAATKLDELLHVVDVEIADAPAADLAGGDQRLERVDSFLERDIAAPVQEIEVDLVDAETPETAFAGRNGASPRCMVRQHLADQEQPVATPTDRLPDQFLAATVRIHLRRIDQRHPEIDAEAQRRDLVRSPPRIFPHVPSPLPERGYASAGGKRDGARAGSQVHGDLPSDRTTIALSGPPGLDRLQRQEPAAVSQGPSNGLAEFIVSRDPNAFGDGAPCAQDAGMTGKPESGRESTVRLEPNVSRRLTNCWASPDQRCEDRPRRHATERRSSASSWDLLQFSDTGALPEPLA